MFFLCEVVDMRGLVFVIDTPFSTVPFDICKFVDSEGVSFVNSSTMELFSSCNSLLWRLIFDESVTD